MFKLSCQYKDDKNFNFNKRKILSKLPMLLFLQFYIIMFFFLYVINEKKIE